MNIVKKEIVINFTQKEKEIINGFMDITQKFSNMCKDNKFEMSCRICPFEIFCDTYHNNANDVEKFINQQINP